MRNIVTKDDPWNKGKKNQKQEEKFVLKPKKERVQMTAEGVTELKQVGHTHDEKWENETYSFTCKVLGEKDELLYETHKWPNGSSTYSIHTGTYDVWRCMKISDLNKLEDVLRCEITATAWRRDINSATSQPELLRLKDEFDEDKTIKLTDRQRQSILKLFEKRMAG